MVGGDETHSTISVVDGGMRDRVPGNASARVFEDAAALVGERSHIKDGVVVDSAVGEEAGSRALNVDAIERVDVTDKVVGNAENSHSRLC